MTVPETDQATSTPASGATGTRRRLAHIDAMRPVKQAGVVSTHALLMFAPAGTAIAVGAALMLLHVTREAFLFVSACMLTYSCRGFRIANWRDFYRRRLTLVALPYVAWTIIYWLFTWRHVGGGWTAHAEHLGSLFVSGYYQLYYLVVLLQFYALFPLGLALVRRVNRQGVLVAVSLAVQMAYVSLMHWRVLPSGMTGYWASREILSYQFYLITGMVVAMHLDDVHAWLCSHVKAIIAFTVVNAGIAEAWFFLATYKLSWLGSNSDPFQPVVIPFNIGMIALIYVFGVWLADPARTRATRVAVTSGSDNSYTVFLAQMIFLTMFTWIGWNKLSDVLPWPFVCAAGVVLVFALCVGLSEVVVRTPLARPITGRSRLPFRRMRLADVHPRGESDSEGALSRSSATA